VWPGAHGALGEVFDSRGRSWMAITHRVGPTGLLAFGAWVRGHFHPVLRIPPQILVAGVAAHSRLLNLEKAVGTTDCTECTDQEDDVVRDLFTRFP